MNKILMLLLLFASLLNAQNLRILLYGDSNTYGLRADGTLKRYELSKTWPRILATELKDNYEIITEGLSGRTVNTNKSIFISQKYSIDLNGATLLPSIISSHTPLDLLVIFLGTNEISTRSAKDITQGLKELIDISKFGAKKVLIIAPPKIKIDAKNFFASSVALPELLKQMCAKNGAYFFNAQDVVEFAHGADGVHLSADDHKALGIAIAKQIQEIFK